MQYDDDGRHFGNRLRETRLAAGLSQSELEEISGIPKARLSRYENGHVEPSIQTLARLARALNVSEASLLGDQRAVMEDFFRVLEERGVPVSWTPERGSLPPLGRVREIATFLRALEAVSKEARSASQLEELRRELAGDDDGNPWWRLLAEIVAEWRDELADAAAPVDAAIEHVWEALAERRREPSFGDCVQLLTVHAAKGLEFRHVVVAGGFWRCPPEKRSRRSVASTTWG